MDRYPDSIHLKYLCLHIGTTDDIRSLALIPALISSDAFISRFICISFFKCIPYLCYVIIRNADCFATYIRGHCYNTVSQGIDKLPPYKFPSPKDVCLRTPKGRLLMGFPPPQIEFSEFKWFIPNRFPEND